MVTAVSKGIALGTAAVAAAAAVWAGLGSGASAEGERLSGWPSSRTVGTSARQVAQARADGADLLIRSRSVREAFVDVGTPDESPGDFIVFEERLLAARSDRTIGRDAVRCEVGLRTFTCEATIRIFGKGKIRLAGAFFAERDNVLPVTGGTGRFRAVGGEFKFFDLADGSTLFAIDLTR